LRRPLASAVFDRSRRLTAWAAAGTLCPSGCAPGSGCRCSRTRREGRVAKDALRSASAFSNASSTLPSSLSSSPGRTRRRPCPAGRCRRCSRARTPGALRSLSPAPARSTRRGPARLAFAAHRTSRSSAPSDGARDAAFLNNFLTRRQFCLFLTISCAVVGLSRSNCCVFAVPLAASRSFDR